MSFTDAVRKELLTQGDLSNATVDGKQYNRPYDGRPSTEDTVSAAAKAAGWNETIWDLTGNLPELKIFKK